ncbi:MAG: exonuclease SbcCD subunit D [Muricoprocola sp.]
MKCLHLGDLHIGKSVNNFSMIEDQKYILDQIIDLAEKEKIDAVLIAGDVYDRSVPSEEAVRLLDYFLHELSKRKIIVYMISGNHDSDERLHFGSSLFENSGIFISSRYEGKLEHRVYQDKFGKMNIYLLPFIKASQVRYYYPEEDINTYEDAVRTVLKNADIDFSERNMLLAHQFVVAKGSETILGGSESAAAQSVGTVEMISADIFAGFDYVALGHIHSSQKVGKETVRYCGSPLKYSLSEIRSVKSVPIITVGEKGDLQIECRELQPRREMRHIKGKLEQLLRKENLVTKEDYIYVTLTDEYPIPDVLNVIREYYPNVMKLDYDNAHTRAIGESSLDLKEKKMDFSDLIAEFYETMYGCKMSEEEMEYMMKTAKEAGVINETS